ncbi:MAG TPA: DNA gyrase inhibitor YacG [Myxococcales bacterium]|nr:DNA gyrase inhibitor YacG [Myxococcales bacterium]
MKKFKCPICKQQVEPRNENKTFPFCSPRCRSVDLGNWFSEEYASSRSLDPEADSEALMEVLNKEELN